MSIHWMALASYVVVTSFTPGPNTISAMSLGISHGYGKTARYLFGIASGFFLVMCLCAIVASLLLRSFPAFEPYLRAAASLYIAWLAVHTFFGSLKADPGSSPPLRFHDGLLLQILNPKVLVYGLSLYSSFLQPISGEAALVALSALALTAVSFLAVSTWALAGASFARAFRRPMARRIVSGILSLLLLYSALESSGLLAALR